MTQWGMGLLCAYIALGATSRISWRKAGGIALALTVVVIGVVMISYKTTTPVDKYVQSIDATVYLTGSQVASETTTTQTGANSIGLTNSNTEDTTGVQAATWTTTDHSDKGLGSASDASASDDGGGS